MHVPGKVWFGIGSVMIFVSGFFLIASMATTHWMTLMEGDDPDLNVGLFKYCRQDNCTDLDDLLLWHDESDAIQAVRAMVFLALIGWFTGVVLTTIYFFYRRTLGRNTTFFFCAMAACFASFIFNMIAIAVYKEKVYNDKAWSYLSYSFFLCAVAGAFMTIGTTLGIYGVNSM